MESEIGYGVGENAKSCSKQMVFRPSLAQKTPSTSMKKTVIKAIIGARDLTLIKAIIGNHGLQSHHGPHELNSYQGSS
jgi:hypothetical protein